MSLKVPAALDARLSALARRKRTSRSAVVRAALDAYTGATPGSALDLSRDLCGSLRGGPRDLSTNKKHLAGFGR